MKDKIEGPSKEVVKLNEGQDTVRPVQTVPVFSMSQLIWRSKSKNPQRTVIWQIKSKDLQRM